jgi:hypothetical protein
METLGLPEQFGSVFSEALAQVIDSNSEICLLAVVLLNHSLEMENWF